MSTAATLVFLDCETTGLHPELGHEIWELAIIRRDSTDLWDEEHVWQLRPDLAVADDEALTVNRFHRRFKVPPHAEALWFPQDRREPVEQTAVHAAGQIRRLLDGVHLVGAVPSFDAAMIARLLWRHGMTPAWQHRLVCVETLVAGATGEPVPRGLRHAASTVEVPVDPEARHTAMGDARLARDVYDAVMDLDRRRPPAAATASER